MASIKAGEKMEEGEDIWSDSVGLPKKPLQGMETSSEVAEHLSADGR